MSTERKAVGRPRTLFTDEVLSRLPVWVKQGLSKREIAKRIGTTVPSLSVTASVHQIPLRSGNRELTLQLSDRAHQSLAREAAKMNMAVDQYSALLLERIVDDDLYNAVIDVD